MLSAVFWNVCLFYLFFLCGANKPLRVIDLLFVSHVLQSFPSNGKFISYILYLSRNDLTFFPSASQYPHASMHLLLCYHILKTSVMVIVLCSSFYFDSFRRINVWSTTSEAYLTYDPTHLKFILCMIHNIWGLSYGICNAIHRYEQTQNHYPLEIFPDPLGIFPEKNPTVLK